MQLSASPASVWLCTVITVSSIIEALAALRPMNVSQQFGFASFAINRARHSPFLRPSGNGPNLATCPLKPDSHPRSPNPCQVYMLMAPPHASRSLPQKTIWRWIAFTHSDFAEHTSPANAHELACCSSLHCVTKHQSTYANYGAASSCRQSPALNDLRVIIAGALCFEHASDQPIIRVDAHIGIDTT